MRRGEEKEKDEKKEEEPLSVLVEGEEGETLPREVQVDAVAQLVDFMAQARLCRYRPAELPEIRQDIVCLCCGSMYRPDDVLDGENVFLCANCIRDRIESDPSQERYS